MIEGVTFRAATTADVPAMARCRLSSPAAQSFCTSRDARPLKKFWCVRDDIDVLLR